MILDHFDYCALKFAPVNECGCTVRLLDWVVNNLLTDSQLDVMPPDYPTSFRDMVE
jgi:hypothetical protein